MPRCQNECARWTHLNAATPHRCRGMTRVKIGDSMTVASNFQLSLLDLAITERAGSTREALVGCVAFAQRAEALGYRRVWYAEHHNMAVIASSCLTDTFSACFIRSGSATLASVN